MIAYLSGALATHGPDWLIVVVGGVGLRVGASARTIEAVTRLTQRGGPVMLHTELLVREDMISLVGFRDEAERDWFNLLRAVQGVGAKVALAVLSACPPHELARAVGLKDAAIVARAQGVGPKLAQRIVNELHGKGPALGAVPMPGVTAAGEAAEAIAALTGLGFRAPEASRAVTDAQRALGESAALDSLIAEALRRSGPR
ncbi:MAG: Holliday junction branch migration protein RuvA [Sphingomonadaceae bacterium]|nr:Holliday junction branch migration protein RuvA [Sphingomonadaceae bacterium]